MAPPPRIRLQRQPFTKKKPVYSIVCTHRGKSIKAKPLELLGTYEPSAKTYSELPVPQSPNGEFRGPEWGAPQFVHHLQSANPGNFRLAKRVSWNVDRLKYWLFQGAEPTSTVTRLLKEAGVVHIEAPAVPKSKTDIVPSHKELLRDAVAKLRIDEAKKPDGVVTLPPKAVKKLEKNLEERRRNRAENTTRLKQF